MKLKEEEKKSSLTVLQKLSLFYNISVSKIIEINKYNDSLASYSFPKTLLKILRYKDSDGVEEKNLKMVRILQMKNSN